MNKMFKIFFIVCVLISFPAHASKIIAIVAGEVITTVDLEKRFQMLQAFNQGKMPNDDVTKKRILSGLIDEKLYVQEAKKNNISVSKKELQAKIDLIKNSHPNLDIKQQTLIDQINAQIYWGKLVNMKLFNTVSVSNKEIDEFVSKTTSKNTVNFIQLLIPSKKYNNDLERKIKSITSCADLDKLAKNEGLDKPEYFIMQLEELNISLKPIISRLTVGKVSEIYDEEKGNSKQVFMLCKPSSEQLSHQEKEQIKAILTEKKMMTSAKTLLENIRKKTFIEIHYK